MGKTKFLQLVEKGFLPNAVVIDGMKIWDRLELDAAFDAAKDAGELSERNTFDKVLHLNR
jgi:hypothetical protein